MKELYTENYKTPVKGIKLDTENAYRFIMDEYYLEIHIPREMYIKISMAFLKIYCSY